MTNLTTHPEPPRRRHPARRLLAGALAVALIAAVGVLGWYVTRVNRALEAIPRVDFESVAPVDPKAPTPDAGRAVPTLATPSAAAPSQSGVGGTLGGASERPAPAQPAASAPPARPAVAPTSTGLNFLLLGTDFADSGVSRSDSFMVVHVAADRSKVYIISYPRDSYVDIPGYGKGKINWAYQWGKVPLAKRTLEQLTGVGIDHTLHVDFDGFINLTSAVGGVTVYNATDVTVGKYHYPVGNITIEGEEALFFVRNRYGLPRWDLSRAENQRNVVKAIIMKTLTPEVLLNPSKFSSVLSEAATCIEVDQGLTPDVVRELALSMRLRSSNDIVLMQAPISGFGTLSDGDSVDIVDQPKMDALSAAIKSDTIDAYVAKYGKKGYNF